MNEFLSLFIISILGVSIILMPEFKINEYTKLLLNLIIFAIVLILIQFFVIKQTEIKCLKGNFTYKQIIKYESKQIKDSIGNDKIIYLPVDTTYIKK